MGYESLSSIVLVAIAALLAFVWAPRKARSGMKRASEHRADRFSPSLHLVDASSATRFNDATPPITKGLLMQAEQQRKASKLTPARIAHIRKMRRAAIRRRQILVSSLAVIAIVVLVLAFVLKFSPLFSLIPAALLVIVLGFGVHASAQARAWEAEVAAMVRRGAGATQVLPQTVGPAAKVPAAVAGSKSKDAAKSGNKATGESVDKSDGKSAAAQPVEEETASVTDIMPANEIQAALDRARAEQQSAKAKRAERAAAQNHGSADQVDHGEDDGAQNGSAAEDASQSNASDVICSEVVEDVAADAAQVAAAAAEPEDATNELTRISPSHALDAFEMAASQDLISFSLGASRSGKPVAQAEPESLEIKSTRQVAKAVPVEADPNDQSVQAGQADQTDQSDQSEQSEQRGASFHDSELSGEVEVPNASSDSLGVDVDAVIARRGH